MEKLKTFEQKGGDKKYEKPYGLNVKVRNFYLRHAEKASGIVGQDGKISKSTLSKRGEEESKILGEQLPFPAKHGFKIKWSSFQRTLETGEAKTKGYLGEEERRKFITRKDVTLLDPYAPQECRDLYLKKWQSNKLAIMKDMGIEEEYDKLSTDQQAEIAERAEEPVTEEWLDNKDSELAKLYSPEEAAARLAVLVRRDIKMPKRLKSGSEVDLFRVTHKTITEPLLMKILILPNGGKPKKLKDIGGSLGLNEGWEINSFTNDEGKKEVKLFLYRVDRSGESPKYEKQEYKIDLEELNRLADLGVGLKNERLENA